MAAGQWESRKAKSCWSTWSFLPVPPFRSTPAAVDELELGQIPAARERWFTQKMSRKKHVRQRVGFQVGFWKTNCYLEDQ